MDAPLLLTECIIPTKMITDPPDIDIDDTGFPFDDSDPPEFGRSRNNSLRHHLDDIAARHPEFAEHLRPWGSDFPSFRNTEQWTRKRHPSGSYEDDNRSGVSSSSNESNPHHSEGIFDVDFGLPEHLRGRFDSRRPPQPRASNTSSNPTNHPEEKSDKTKHTLPQYGLRNTVDLGQKQKQELVDEQNTRGQRSMSAPPDNRSNQSQQRFISRINIEPQQADMGNNMAANSSSSQQQQQQQAPPQPQSQPQPTPNTQQKHPNVRHIPIFVEGRDEPVLPKNVEQEPSQPKQPPFGKSPTSFSQFFNRDPPRQSPKPTPPNQHTFEPKPQQFHPQPPPQAQPKQEEPAKAPQHRATPPPQPLDPISKIQVIQKDVMELMNQVENFKGTSRKEKQYLYLDEMLTRNLLKLDDIDTEGKDNIRQARKEAIKCIERCISILEAKAAANAAAANQEQQNMEIESIPSENPESNNASLSATNTNQTMEPSDNIEQMETEPTKKPSSEGLENPQGLQALQVGGLVKSGSEVVNTETQKTDSKSEEQCEPSSKKKGKKSASNTKNKTSDKEGKKDSSKLMEVDPSVESSAENQIPSEESTSQNVNIESSQVAT